ncbi:hypothetical protein [Erythrobacter longus]|uniref:hypothetical protein n=1 Tax=Erythrobacter longus TaxID=1044 RepID=UPI001268D46C|nr:hypothetical protein [Erythrobacter longus]
MGDALYFAVVCAFSLLAFLSGNLRYCVKDRLRPTQLHLYTAATLALPLVLIGLVLLTSIVLGPAHQWNQAGIESVTVFEAALIFLVGVTPFWLGFWFIGLAFGMIFENRTSS